MPSIKAWPVPSTAELTSEDINRIKQKLTLVSLDSTLVQQIDDLTIQSDGKVAVKKLDLDGLNKKKMYI